jgi:beta propeller repeat protein
VVSRRTFVRLILPVVLVAVFGVGAVAYGYVTPAVEQRLTTNAAQQVNPAISGTNVVWQDYRNGNWEVYYCELTAPAGSERSDKRLTAGVPAQTLASMPAISGDHVVYEDYSHGTANVDICMYDLATDTETRITTSTVNQNGPAISGDHIVYRDLRDIGLPTARWALMLYEISTGKTSQLTTDGARPSIPSVSGDNVVWTDSRDGQLGRARLCYHNIATGEERFLTEPLAQAGNAQVDGNLVVFDCAPGGNQDVYLYDLSTDTQTRLTSNRESQYSPDISGNKVVYMDNREGNWNIYMYDVATRTEAPLTTDPTDQSTPRIDGDRVVYEDSRNGNPDIYLSELATPRMSATAPSTVAYGATARLTGTLTSFTGTALAGRSVRLETSVDGLSWTAEATTTSGATGGYAFTSSALTSARYLRATFTGELANLSAQSASVLVKPKASLGAPVAPSTMSHSKTYTVYATLKPQHAAGTSGGTLQCYRLESGKWKLRKSFALSAYDYSTYSRARASVKLTSTGKWRMRVYHSDAGHATTYSAWRNVTVK